jgi:Na+/proline symporter
MSLAMADELFHLAPVDIAIVVAYFACAVGVGAFLSRFASRGISDYFLGGRKIPWWVMGMSGTASNFDMTGTMVIVSFFFAIGLQGFWVSMRGGMCLPLGILMVYMGKWLRRSKVMTTAEWMELRFGKGTDGQAARTLSAVANLVVTVAFLTYFVKGTGKFLAVFLPFSPEVCSLIMVGVALLYTTLSGFYGVVYTDVLQEILMLSVSIFIGYQALTLPDHAETLAFAGAEWSSFVPQWTADPMTWLSDPLLYQFFGLTIIFWIARGVLEGAGGLTGGYMPQRYYAAKNEREAGLLTAEWILLLLFRWALIVGTAVLALSLAREFSSVAELLGSDPEKTLPVVLGKAIPAGFRGLLVAGLIAAAMSTFDSTINAGAAYWVKDIFQRHLRPDATHRQLMRQSYGATICLAAAGVGIGLAVHNIDDIWGWITGPLSAGLFAPIVLRWYWWRFNGWGFAISTAVGLLFSILLKILDPNLPLYISFPLTWACSLAAGIIGSLLTRPTEKPVLENFWQTIRPFGIWGKATQDLDNQRLKRVKRENRLDLLTVVFAIAWHLSGVVAIISLILHKWDVLTWAAAVFALTLVVLYFSWYRRLDRPDTGAHGTTRA